MGYGRVGRIYVEDETGGGVYHIEEGELCHTPMLPDGRIEWGASAAVDLFRIDEDLAESARAAGRLLCCRMGYSPHMRRRALGEGRESE